MPVFQWAVVEANLNPVVGTEQRGIRPVLVVSNEDFNQAMPNVTVLPLTSTSRRLYPAEVSLPERKAGQPGEAIIIAHQIRTISKKKLGKILGYLADIPLQQAVNKAIKDHLDIDITITSSD